MAHKSITAGVKKPLKPSNRYIEPLLKRIHDESKTEFAEMQQAFELMGWSDIPEELKMEIYEDVKFMVMELKGYFCSTDPFVQQRRNSVHYWVSCYLDGICALDTAVNALKIRKSA